MGTGCPGEHPTDQRLDDGGALVFDTLVLERELSVLGPPLLRLQVSSDAPVAQLAVRLSDVAPDGRVTRVSYQVLNLTHRDGHEHPSRLAPGRYYDVSVTLNACGYRFLPGHRIRLSIATAYWPIVWPAPYPATLSIRTGESAMELPVRQDDRGTGGVVHAAGPWTEGANYAYRPRHRAALHRPGPRHRRDDLRH